MEKDKFEAPTWLNKDFIEKILKDNDKDPSIVVKNITVTRAVGKGDNYSSCLHRIAIDLENNGGKTEKRSLIVKSLPETEMMAKLVVNEGMFGREVAMYFEHLPALYALNSEFTRSLSPRAYMTDRAHTLVMDDLLQVGYKMAQRHKGLDARHTKVALGALASFHALSLSLLAKDPTSLDGVTELFYKEEKKEMNKQFLEPGIRLLASYVEKWPGFERFGDKLREIAWVDRVTDLTKVREGDLAVLNHGDCWTNNMLFRYSETGEVEDVKFIDFQICRYNSPAMDLQYFMYSSPNEDVREQHRDEVLKHYHSCLMDTVRTLGCEDKAFTFDQLMQDVHHFEIFGLFTACFILPIVLADPEDAPELSKMTEEDLFDNVNKADFGKSYNAARFREVFQKILLSFEKSGTL